MTLLLSKFKGNGLYLLDEPEAAERNCKLGDSAGRLEVDMGPDIARLHGFLPNGGFGYRLELQPRSNVRVDFGFGRNSRGIYFNFTEAF